MNDILACLREVEPDVVIAFHPLGISGHPDHMAMTAFAIAARERLAAEAGDDRSDWRARLRLFFYTIPASVARKVTHRQMPLVPDEEISIQIDTRAYAEVKRRAIRAHKTQFAYYERLISLPGDDGRFAVERFATYGGAPDGARGDDLFTQSS
jgi:LmbE family N-acetylglucosaminyl deacetylase